MSEYVFKRMLALIPTLFFASLIVFVSIRLVPGDVIDLMLAQNDVVSTQDRESLRAALGMDQPLWRQYLDWAGGALQGDLGRSLWENAPVTALILQV